MTTTHAIAILLAAERDPAIRSTPDFAEATEHVRADSEALDWFETERAFYAANPGLLSAARLRPEVRERIRAALPAETIHGQVEAMQAEPIRFPRRALYWAVAAAALLLIGLFTFPMLTPDNGLSVEANSFADFGTQVLDGSFGVENTKTVQDSADHLHEQGAPFEQDVFAHLSDQPTMGCQVLSWNDRQVSLVCIKTPSNEIVHVMIMNQDDLTSDEDAKFVAGRREVNGRQVESWKDKDKVYLALAHGREKELSLPVNWFGGG